MSKTLKDRPAPRKNRDDNERGKELRRRTRRSEVHRRLNELPLDVLEDFDDYEFFEKI